MRVAVSSGRTSASSAIRVASEAFIARRRQLQPVFRSDDLQPAAGIVAGMIAAGPIDQRITAGPSPDI